MMTWEVEPKKPSALRGLVADALAVITLALIILIAWFGGEL